MAADAATLHSRHDLAEAARSALRAAGRALMLHGALQAPAAVAVRRAPFTDPRFVGRIALLAAAAFGYAVILTPILFVCWLSFFANEIVTFPPQSYTLRWFAHIFDQNNFVSGFVTSLQVGIVAGPRQRVKLQSETRLEVASSAFVHSSGTARATA